MSQSQWHLNSTNQPPHKAMPLGTTKEFFLLAICTAIILILALFFFLTKLVRRLRQTHHSPSNTSSIPPATTLMPQQSLGLGEEGIERLPVSVHQSFDLAKECCICLSEFEDMERIKVLPDCQHTYHSDCLDSWLGTQSSCPLCRVCLKSKTPSASNLFSNV
ncbi:unnamed protein product [Rhodiola kirilowii]